jgi:hypothetical protein
MAKQNYNFSFCCIDNSGYKQFLKIKASSKPEAIEKGMKKAKANAKGDINNWECRLVLSF